jgi:AraC-like DNA-binding protein
MKKYQQSMMDVLKCSFIEEPKYKLFSSDDLQETRDLVSKIMKPHQLSLKSKSLEASMHASKFGGISFCRLTYGGDVTIDPGCLEDFYLVQMPVSGNAVINCGNQYINSDIHFASVLSPSQPTSMLWYHNNDQVMVRIDKTIINKTLAAYHGVDELKDTIFNLGFNWLNSDAWCNVMLYLSQASNLDLDLSNNTLVISQIEQLVAAALITAQANTYSTFKSKSNIILPKHVRYVKDYIDEHANEAIVMADLAQYASVSLRGLYFGFNQYCGISPMQYLKKVRLEKIHDILCSKQCESVTEVALSWGFMHLGRFSMEYKQRYGESPSETLRR